jgi:hypothetical protein
LLSALVMVFMYIIRNGIKKAPDVNPLQRY